MKKTVAIAALMAAFAGPALACDKPNTEVSIPDGKSAAMEDMMAAKKNVDAVKKDMEEYLSCEKNAAKAEKAQAELVKLADRFNVEVRAFKSKG
jgi:hypothetical protein